MDSTIYEILRYARKSGIPLGTAVVAMAAEARGLKWERAESPFRISIEHRGRKVMIKGGKTSRLDHDTVHISSNKYKAARIMALHGVPVPKQHVVESEVGAQERAWSIGFPVVVKPLRGEGGLGVSVHLSDRFEVGDAFRRAQALYRKVLVESWIEGRDHRILVVGDRVAAVAQRTVAQVIGDGSSTINELVEALHFDPRRKPGHQNIFSSFSLDEDSHRVLRQQGMTSNSVPSFGQIVPVHSFANISAGGTTVDVTHCIHEDNAKAAIKAAKCLNLEIAGVDFLCPDIAKSYRTVGGAICEVNSVPGLRIHVTPLGGKVQDIGGAIVDLLLERHFGVW